MTAPVDTGQPGVLRRDDAVQRDRGVPGLWRAVVVAQQADDGGLGRLRTLATDTYPVGHGGDGAHALLLGLRQHGTTEVLVVFFAARQ